MLNKFQVVHLFKVLPLFLLFCSGCKSANSDMDSLMSSIDEYETAWATSDFLTVESFFTADAKRLHTETEVWDRSEIKRYFEEKAKETKAEAATQKPTDWKKDREYIEIRIEGDIAYDIFTTDRFKAMHIWERQDDGTWKIKYDMGILNASELE